MKRAVVYFNSASGLDIISKCEYAYKLDLKVIIDSKEYLFEDVQSLAEHLEKEKKFAKTSQPTTIEMIELFEKLEKEYDEIFVITPSKYLSGTHQNAVLASSDFKDNIHIIESKSFAITEHAVTMDVINSIDEEKSTEELLKSANSLARRIHTYIVPGGFEFLKLSGRVSFAKALVATLLKVKLIVDHIEPEDPDAETNSAEVVFQGRGLNSLFKEIDRLLSDNNIKNVYFTSLFEDQQLKDKFFALVKSKNLPIQDIGLASQIILCHIGPKSFGFALEFNE